MMNHPSRSSLTNPSSLSLFINDNDSVQNKHLLLGVWIHFTFIGVSENFHIRRVTNIPFAIFFFDIAIMKHYSAYGWDAPCNIISYHISSDYPMDYPVNSYGFPCQFIFTVLGDQC